ncbi:hypothetical protein GGI04_002363 [Coemansia thaxteri]|uniref:Nucleolar protein 12 n=1 Tax=Coemansia thaxteri TaxID=2663907 RepID=A0A9W8EEH2_9FUNG|nr:hypothetical protein H4R26_003944 [Coemansia thaxteri]KAJ2005149.1 hypothetical protein GGI04_002363 [Coemansia thaxteri]KAJ2471395.1 hypothetical protein GGI02_002294 [Coemansia sp. RSA 2322]KAJ2480175.1 hypothetical protein EV174_003801 [Coemansia sp. RSA 2320]
MRDNAAALTAGGKIYAKKRKARKDQVEQVEFDPKARQKFLTGFHKRKLERREHAIAQAKAKEREERLEMRREKREQQKDILAQRILENKSFYGTATSDNEDDDGQSTSHESGSESDSDSQAGPATSSRDSAKDVAVLTSESAVTTVTIIKDFDPARLEDEEVDLERKLSPQGLIKKIVDDVVKRTKQTSDDEAEQAGNKKPKKKKAKKFRYETKAKRAMKNTKDRAANKDRGAAKRAARGAKDKGAAKKRR